MFPTNPQALSDPDQLKKQAQDLAKSELEAGADRLIQNSPTASQMAEHYEEVQELYRGVPELSFNDIKNLVISEAEELSEEILAKVADAYGIPFTSTDIRDWAQQGADYLIKEGKEYLAEAATEAMAQYGVTAIYQNVSAKVAPFIGLIATTKEALEDGELSQGEIMTISTTAMTSASTAFATGAAVGLGVVGAVLAPAAIGTAYLESIVAAEEEFRRKARLAAQQQTAQSKAELNAFLQEAENQLNEADDQLWLKKEQSISAVAQNWAMLEHQVGRSFELRFFPGDPPPLRGGWYRKQPLTSGGSFMQKVACEKISGCPYFPGSESYKTLAESIQYFQRMQQNNLYLSKDGIVDGKYHAFNPYQFPQIAQLYGGSRYAYYWRTLRAFDAFVPHTLDSSGRSAGFWTHPGHELRMQKKRLKDFGLLAWDVLCARDPYKCRQLCIYSSGQCHIPEHVMRKTGEGFAEDAAFAETVHNVASLDMAKEAMEYVDELFARMQEDYEAVDTYRTRIRGNLAQTAGAVRGEMAAAKRLGDVARIAGFQPNTQVVAALDKQAKKSIHVLDEQTRGAMGDLEERRQGLNKTFMLAGGALLAAGAGTWLARKK